MDTEQAMSSVWYVLALVLVGSALLARRQPMAGMFRMALLWILIFAVLLGLFHLGQKTGLFAGRTFDEAPTSQRGAIEAPPVPTARIEGEVLRIPMAPDGHFWVEAMANGTPIRFLIDSGASVTALSVSSARAAGLNFDLNGRSVTMTTANGKIEAARSSISTLVIGPIRASDIDIVISPAFAEVNVIGMNVLSRLKSWGVQNGEMVLTP